MKSIELQKIVIDNFRGIKHFETKFGQALTTIVGDNATGKSTIFAAFTWALFGKDEEDRKDYEIKPTVDGVSVRVETSVELLLSIDGEQYTLKRTFKEKWQKPKGCVEEVFKGNETTCEWNGVPVNVSEYSKRVSAIVDESLFKMLTNPYYFPTLHWQKQRAALFNMIPAITDEEIAQKDAEFAALLDSINGKSMADFKAEIERALRGLREEHRNIEPKIEELRRQIPEQTESAEGGQLDAVVAEIDAIGKQLQSKADAVKAQDEAIAAERKAIAELNTKAMNVRQQRISAEAARVNEANAKRNELKMTVDAKRREVEMIAAEVKRGEEYMKTLQNSLDYETNVREKLRAEYAEVAAKEFVFDDTCPTCGQKMPQSMRDAAERRYNEQHEAELNNIVARGNTQNERIAGVEKSIEETKQQYDANVMKHAAESEKLNELQKQLDDMPVVEQNVIDFNADEELNGIKQQIAQHQKRVDDMIAATSTEEEEQKRALVERQKELMQQRDEMVAANANAAMYAKFEERIGELKAEGRRLAQQIADYERKVFVVTKFSHAKVEELEKHVNALFTSVRWKLFDYTVEGNAVETCVPVVGNALYPVANTAAQINAGLDIIHTLSQHYALRCPIFIDNAEGITKIESRDLQLISLYVVAGAKLEVTNIQ